MESSNFRIEEVRLLREYAFFAFHYAMVKATIGQRVRNSIATLWRLKN
jgi:hypothetical protein